MGSVRIVRTAMIGKAGQRTLLAQASVLRSQEMGQIGFSKLKSKKITSNPCCPHEPNWGLLGDRKTNKETMTTTKNSKLYKTKEVVKVRRDIWRKQEEVRSTKVIFKTKSEKDLG